MRTLAKKPVRSAARSDSSYQHASGCHPSCPGTQHLHSEIDQVAGTRQRRVLNSHGDRSINRPTPPGYRPHAPARQGRCKALNTARRDCGKLLRDHCKVRSADDGQQGYCDYSYQFCHDVSCRQFTYTPYYGQRSLSNNVLSDNHCEPDSPLNQTRLPSLLAYTLLQAPALENFSHAGVELHLYPGPSAMPCACSKMSWAWRCSNAAAAACFSPMPSAAGQGHRRRVQPDIGPSNCANAAQRSWVLSYDRHY